MEPAVKGPRVGLVLVAVVLGALVGGWFWTFERAERLVPRLPPAVASDPWLPARCFLSSMGAEVRPEPELSRILPALGTHDVLVLDGLEGRVGQTQAEHLREWILAGGTLVVADDPGVDRILGRCLLPGLGISRDTVSRRPGWCPESLWAGAPTRRFAPTAPETSEESPVPDNSRSDSLLESEGGSQDTTTVRRPLSTASVDSLLRDQRGGRELTLPGGVRRTAATGSVLRLRWRGSAPRLVHADPEGGLVVAASGKGCVVALAFSGLWNPFSLRRRDNGEILWRLVSQRAPPTRVWFPRYGTFPSWWRLLLNRAWPALLALLLALFVSVWCAGSGFGPTEPPAGEGRRGILDHAEASGRWLWSLPGGPELLAASMRNLALRTLRSRHPDLSSARPAEIARALSRDSGLDERETIDALEEGAIREPAAFARTTRILWTLWRKK